MKDAAEEHFEGKIAQKVIIEKNGRVLLVQDPREDNDIWELPGGRMNVDEDPIVSVKREFLEEMGCKIDVYEVVHMEQFIQGSEGKRAFVIVYRAELKNAEENFNLDDDEVSKVKWFSSEEISEIDLFPEYENALEKYFNKL